MKIVHVDHRNAELEDSGRKIVVRSGGRRRATIPMRLVERLVVSSSCRISSSLLFKLNAQGTGVLLVPGRYSQGAPVHVVRSGTDFLLFRAQVDAGADPQGALSLASYFVQIKVRGHLVLLEELLDRHLRHRLALSRARDHLEATLENLQSGTGDKNWLRGVEGAASARFFKGWGACMPRALKFSVRNRRPPLDPVNVCLSIGYTLAHHEALVAACSLGLESRAGFLHDPRVNRDSLACDIVETARPVVDRWVYDLFRDAGLRPEHFSSTSTGCLAGKAGRRLIYENYFETTARKIRAVCAHHAAWLRGELIARQRLGEDVDSSPGNLFVEFSDET